MWENHKNFYIVLLLKIGSDLPHHYKANCPEVKVKVKVKAKVKVKVKVKAKASLQPPIPRPALSLRERR